MSIQFSRGRSELAAGAFSSILDIVDIAGMAIGKAKMHTLSGCMVELIGRNILTQPVVPSIGKP
ncbi:MAG: hypothetical protein JW384_01756 [Nitrosomonadaceae bacterium]|nr:hypothetical protein [Nitrosomonadaceae bacterium]